MQSHANPFLDTRTARQYGRPATEISESSYGRSASSTSVNTTLSRGKGDPVTTAERQRKRAGLKRSVRGLTLTSNESERGQRGELTEDKFKEAAKNEWARYAARSGIQGPGSGRSDHEAEVGLSDDDGQTQRHDGGYVAAPGSKFQSSIQLPPGKAVIESDDGTLSWPGMRDWSLSQSGARATGLTTY